MVLLGGSIRPAALPADTHPIDVQRSVIKIRVYKSGLFSAFAHNHEIEAPIAEGKVAALESPAVELRVDARKLRVLDPELPSAKRAEVQKTMDGEVLNGSRYPEIRFQSTAVENRGPGRWTVRGNLTLHGQSRPVAAEVVLKDGRYLGSAVLRQKDFGITPVRIAGGTVSVKNEVKVEFDIVLAK